jgi:hypothetical protein
VSVHEVVGDDIKEPGGEVECTRGSAVKQRASCECAGMNEQAKIKTVSEDAVQCSEDE